jgi:hypothetical protein
VLPTFRYRQPDDDNPDDRTVFSVETPWPVAAGERLEIRVTWESRLPRVRRRTGIKGDFLFCAQWFPKLGVYEGGRGWNCHQFHRNTEFYADYGTYDVTLNLPGAYAGAPAEDGERGGDPKVGASGVMTAHRVIPDGDDAGRLEVTFAAPSPADRERSDPLAVAARDPRLRVHGFAWTADPDFVVKQRTFRFDDWKDDYKDQVADAARVLGRTPDEIATRDVEVRILMQPERAGQWERHYHATCAALFFYGLWWGEYPYEQVTVVDPAWGAGAAGGMEYPTLFTCGTRLFTNELMHSPESVTVHEAGHQFWYGLVGNNEYEAAWLDEGLNSYTDAEVLHHVYGPRHAATWYAGLPVMGRAPGPQPIEGLLGQVLDEQGWDLPKLPVELSLFGDCGFLDYWRDQPRLTFVDEYSDPRQGDRRGYLRDPETDPIQTFAFEYADGTSYGTNSYARTAASLRTLKGVVGNDAFLKGMRHFAETWRYRHPYPEDFYASFIEGSGVDVGWYFEDVFQGSATVDWSVSVSKKRTPGEAGYRWDEDGNPVLIGDEEESEADPPPDGEDPPPRKKPDHVYDVVVRRNGDLRMDLDVRVTYEAGPDEEVGEEVDFTWTREEQADAKWFRLPLEPSPREIHSVVVDPHKRSYLDEDLSNNRWFSRGDERAPLRWLERKTTWSAGLLQFFSRVGG